ncbi:hypothetical protein EMCG_05259 [[Emmonsia] crescens]|uniref:Uncharacterized protein n=1 Tax=[Emmonsia] crescens TaxID=73230 RepID=A0A0G2HPE2_9EURO|nr:hypothetical protein EMCG_05259 [Emmonsia crescens UAMH 3008]
MNQLDIFSYKMYSNISYALLSAALIMLSTVHLILLIIHHSQSHYLSEISIFILFICINAVIIDIDLSDLRPENISAFYYLLRICTAFLLALEIHYSHKIQRSLMNALLH